LQFIHDDPEPKKRMRYVKIMRALKHKVPPQRLPNLFNRLNALAQGKENHLIHYTKEPQQPQYHPEHPYAYIMEEYLKECLDKEIVTKDELRQEIKTFQPHRPGRRGTGFHPYWQKLL
jgi:hypothetical protein